MSEDSHTRFVDGIATSGAGLIVIFLDLAKLGTVALGLVGAGFAVIGGWHAFHSKRAERKLKELELEIKLLELQKLHENAKT